MNPIRLEENGALRDQGGALAQEAITLLGRPILLDPACTLRSFFRMLKCHNILQRLNPYISTLLEQFGRCPPQDCLASGLKALQLSRIIEMTGFPAPPAIRIYMTLEGFGPEGCCDIRWTNLAQILDLPLRLGQLKHTVFGDPMNSLEFDTTFNLFELIDGICWELSFHNLPDRCKV
ncbi:MAG: hypothetical protein M0036_05885 [Desulfobacteraceae bacterium]|nr:hypothetical protein [Desulfobacteraceae bacterium]